MGWNPPVRRNRIRGGRSPDNSTKQRRKPKIEPAETDQLEVETETCRNQSNLTRTRARNRTAGTKDRSERMTPRRTGTPAASPTSSPNTPHTPHEEKTESPRRRPRIRCSASGQVGSGS
ncbi:hypothetical protein BD309DRAFT_958277 [Dichomitus squalens]|nr:hypothetical protein BD309DRAFT_958277 [Dichomitus squalens]